MKTIEEAQVLTAAIRTFTEEAPNNEPNGPYEADIESLRFALGRNDIKGAKRHFRDMCENLSSATKALRVGAEGYFGGDFRRGIR